MKRSLPSPTKPSNTNSPTRSPARKIAASTKPNNSNVATYTLTADECANLAATIDLFQSIGVDGEVNDEEVSAIAAVAPADCREVRQCKFNSSPTIATTDAIEN